ncbi:hypothetical protein A2Z22_01235 [Candidatus Woesebacteria bacterium RBG_16_34_12]|uniref:phosphoserine phosphatase n=1 Tax=Candidatus Woesebacteria bacterium RBG_16_34_12 TaxID=1802480 RepID=A0A1F7X9E6_9BACT|nr:MAG: hypothetical protein A2Z22_01235 [Candidatus Woesebacteria bacterium RBG_16_34_12]
MKKILCFDVDGTLVDGVSWLLLTKGLGCSQQEHLEIFNKAKNSEISFIEGERMLTRMYQKSGNATKTYITSLFSKTKPRPVSKKVISLLKKKGYKIYLISGAIDIYVEAIAKMLNVDGFFANSSLEFDENQVLSKIHYRDNQGEVKVEQLKKLTDKLRIDVSRDVVFIGDSENDIEAFRITGKGISVHSNNKKLKSVAWENIDSLEELLTIL